MNIEFLFSIFVETFSCWAVLSQFIILRGEGERGADVGAELINNQLPLFNFFVFR